MEKNVLEVKLDCRAIYSSYRNVGSRILITKVCQNNRTVLGLVNFTSSRKISQELRQGHISQILFCY